MLNEVVVPRLVPNVVCVSNAVVVALLVPVAVLNDVVVEWLVPRNVAVLNEVVVA